MISYDNNRQIHCSLLLTKFACTMITTMVIVYIKVYPFRLLWLPWVKLVHYMFYYWLRQDHPFNQTCGFCLRGYQFSYALQVPGWFCFNCIANCSSHMMNSTCDRLRSTEIKYYYNHPHDLPLFQFCYFQCHTDEAGIVLNTIHPSVL